MSETAPLHVADDGAPSFPGGPPAVSARLLRDFQVQLTMGGGERAGHGPWTLVIDEAPEVGSSGVGPPPVPLAYAALAGCTIVTLAGVARRRKMAVEGMRAEVEVGRIFASKVAVEEAAAAGTPVNRRQGVVRIVLTGSVTQAELDVLKRSAQHCPVGRMMQNGIVEFRHEFVVEPPPGQRAL